jgi:hypothetical protein
MTNDPSSNGSIFYTINGGGQVIVCAAPCGNGFGTSTWTTTATINITSTGPITITYFKSAGGGTAPTMYMNTLTYTP